jgi:hypothetical protein
MVPFLSSTLLDLVKEREAVLAALRKKRLLTQAMEDFLASPHPPSETALRQLRASEIMVLAIGFKAGRRKGAGRALGKLSLQPVSSSQERIRGDTSRSSTSAQRCLAEMSR